MYISHDHFSGYSPDSRIILSGGPAVFMSCIRKYFDI